jgi:hypothetical protein
MAKDAISGSFDCDVTPYGRSVSAEDDRVRAVVFVLDLMLGRTP